MRVIIFPMVCGSQVSVSMVNDSERWATWLLNVWLWDSDMLIQEEKLNTGERQKKDKERRNNEEEREGNMGRERKEGRQRNNNKNEIG